MIAIVERSLFIHAYKFDYIYVPIERFFDYSIEEIRNEINTREGELRWADLFDSVFPHFEEPHELVFVELDRNMVHFGTRIKVAYDGILSLIPLSNDGYMLLKGRMGSDVLIQKAFFETAINELKIKRRNRSAEACVKSLFHIFGLKQLDDGTFLEEAENVFRDFSLSRKELNGSFLYELVSYDRTPSNLPEGNAEYLCKVGLIAAINAGQVEKAFQNGYYYKWCVNKASHINDKTFSDALEYYFSVTGEGKDSDVKLLESHNKLLGAMKVEKPEDFFKTAFYYIAFRSLLQQYEFDISQLYDSIQFELERNRIVVAKSLYLLAQTFPFERLYEGIHKLRRIKSESIISIGSLTYADNIHDEPIQHQAEENEFSNFHLDADVSNRDFEEVHVEHKQTTIDSSVNSETQDDAGDEVENSSAQAPTDAAIPSIEQIATSSSNEKRRLIEIIEKYVQVQSDYEPNLNMLIEQLREKRDDSIGVLVDHVKYTFQHCSIPISDDLENELGNLEAPN